jgi:uncharacterized protein (DUF433 family)
MKLDELVVEDPEILSGTPVIRGTRVPVYHIAALVDSGTSVAQILKSYPSLKGWQVELASAYAKAVPPSGRPERIPSWRKQSGWKEEITHAFEKASVDLRGTTRKEILGEIKLYRGRLKKKSHG